MNFQTTIDYVDFAGCVVATERHLVEDLPVRADGNVFDAVYNANGWIVCRARGGSWYRLQI